VSETTSATATFLFTDVEGSTQLLRSHRQAYERILSDHHRILREAFATFGGREIDNQGDSFFIAFARAKDALLAAATAQRALAAHTWPDGALIRVRMGIHTGEADLTPDRYIGLSVHRAARISAIAHGGQVIVSQTTANLVEDDEDDLPGIRLKDLGEHRLKDVSRPVRLFQLEISGLPTAFPRLATPASRKSSARKRVVLVAALAVLGLAIGSAFVLAARPDAAPEVVPNSLVRLDPKTLKVKEVVRIGGGPDLVRSAGGFLWITHYVLGATGEGGEPRNSGDRTLTRVDPSRGDVTTVGGGLAPCGLTADPSGDVWVSNCFAAGSGARPNVVRVDAETLNFEATWPVPKPPEQWAFHRSLAYGGGSLWITSASSRGGGWPVHYAVTEINPDNGKLKRIALSSRAAALAWSEGYGDLWASNYDDGTVTRIHPATGAVEVVETLAHKPGSIVVDGDLVWVADRAAPTVMRVMPTGQVVDVSLPVRPAFLGVETVAAGAGAIWATTPRQHALWRIDPKTTDTTRIPIPYAPTGVTVDGDDVWITVRAA
jgi:class 3 adenylate cyclase/streptogramin lyase